jgi:hypothetical protein
MEGEIHAVAVVIGFAREDPDVIGPYGFPEDRFLGLQLVRVLPVLVGTAAAAAEIGTERLGHVGHLVL